MILAQVICKPRGRYARVAFELTLRNLGLASLPGPLPSGADHQPASLGVPMDSDNRCQPTHARTVRDPRTSPHALGPPRCWPPILPCMGRTPHCGRAASRTRTRTTTNHGIRTTAGRLVELDSSHFGIRLIPTQAKASTSSSPTGRADSPARGVPRKLAGRSPGAASRHPSGTLRLLCLHVTKPGSDGQESTPLLPLDATRSSPCRRLGYIVTKGPATIRIQPADH